MDVSEGPHIRASVVIVLVVSGLAASACPGLLSDERISEGEADKIKERNAEVAASLPVFADSRLVRESQTKCEGAFQREDSAACPLRLTYETSRPLAEALAFYESHFASDGWILLDIDVVRTTYFEGHGVLVEVFLWVPFQTCPDPFIELDAARACEEEWILNEGGDFSITISPD